MIIPPHQLSGRCKVPISRVRLSIKWSFSVDYVSPKREHGHVCNSCCRVRLCWQLSTIFVWLCPSINCYYFLCCLWHWPTRSSVCSLQVLNFGFWVTARGDLCNHRGLQGKQSNTIVLVHNLVWRVCSQGVRRLLCPIVYTHDIDSFFLVNQWTARNPSFFQVCIVLIHNLVWWVCSQGVRRLLCPIVYTSDTFSKHRVRIHLFLLFTCVSWLT